MSNQAEPTVGKLKNKCAPQENVIETENNNVTRSPQIEPKFKKSPTINDCRAKSRDVELYHDEFEAKKPLQLVSIAHPPPAHGYIFGLLSERIKDRINTYCKSIEISNNKLEVALIFTNDTSRVGYAKYHHTFPCDLLVVQCQYLITKDRFPEGYPDYVVQERKRDIATALLVPGTPDVKVKYAHFSLKSPDVESFVQKLCPEEDCKSTLILFGDSPKINTFKSHNCMTEVRNCIHKRFVENQYTLWGEEVPIIYAGKDSRTMDDKDVVFGMNIYGSGVNSYSLFIPTDTPYVNIHLKIVNFKKRIRMKKHSIGFVSFAMLTEASYREFITRLLKCNFPNTVFTFTLRYQDTTTARQTYVLGRNSFSKPKSTYTEEMSVGAFVCYLSLMIITFDSDHSEQDFSRGEQMGMKTELEEELKENFDSLSTKKDLEQAK